MEKWTLYVNGYIDDSLIVIEIDSNRTFLEFRQQAAAELGVDWKDLVLCSKHEYDKQYNPKTLKQMHEMEPKDIYNGTTFDSIETINGGTFRY
jgi:hypothetical protein